MIARRKETMQVQELVGIVPWTFIAQICNLFIQMYLIKRFLFKPINEMLEKRRAAADAEITDAEAAKKKKPTPSKRNMSRICREAKEKSQRDSRKRQKDSNAAERENRKRGFRTGGCPEKQGRKRDCPGEKKAVNEVKGEIGGIAMDIAGKVIEREINEKTMRS